jgi:putative variant cofactor biosynthesis B12-binding/radical SAM domain protein 1
MEALHEEYGIGSFHFTDPVLNVPQGHLEEICREILRRKLKVRWDGFLRENLLNEQNVALFEKAGCECFSFSPDGLCGQSMKVLGKRMKESDVLKAAALVARTDVISVYHFMVNVPGETEETCTRGINLLERLYELHHVKRNLGTIVLNNIRILPGTPIEERARKDGVIGPGTDLLYPVYYNPPPFDAMRHKLETLHFCRNVFSWQEIE